MKRIICLIIALCLILGSFSFAFAADASWSTTDSQNLSNVAGRLYYMNQSAAYYLYNIASNTNNIYNKCVDIYNALFYGNHNITYWVNAISTWMSPLYTAVTSIPTDLSVIEGLLGYPSSDGGGTTWHPYLKLLEDIKPALVNMGLEFTAADNAHARLFLNNGSALYQFATVDQNGQTGNYQAFWNDGSPLGNIALITKIFSDDFSRAYSYRWSADLTGYNSLQSLISFANPSSTVTFTPYSSTDGIYKYLNAINTPLARLGYVLASDQRISAQQAAAANEQAVVNNFVDSNGSGSAGVSDFANIASLSSGYKSNFNTQANASGMFNIFNQNNMGWFSQETLDQLDTTQTQTRGLLKSSKPDTPLLDQQIRDIYDQIGVKHD